MTVAVIFVFVAVLGGIIWLTTAIAAKRTRELGKFATGIGFTFEKGPFTPGVGPFVGAGGFQIFNKGYDRKITNVAHGRMDDAEVQIFDYQYEWSVGGEAGGMIGVGHNQATYTFTAAVFTSSGGTRFPTMEIYPEGLFSKLGTVLGGQDIDFAEFPEFSKRFVLKSTDEATVRAIFDQPTAAFFEAHTGVTVNTTGQSLVFYRAKHRAKTAGMRHFLDTSILAYRTLAAASSRVRR